MVGPRTADDALTPGAQLFHGFNRAAVNTEQRAFPARMGRTDHARFASANSSGPQSAVNTPSATPGVSVTSPSTFGPLGHRPRHNRHIRAMHLIAGNQMICRNTQRQRRLGAVLLHSLNIIATAQPSIHRGKYAARKPALAREKAMGNMAAGSIHAL